MTFFEKLNRYLRPRFEKYPALFIVIIGGSLLVFALIFSIALFSKTTAVAFSAAGTVTAVIWAIFHQNFLGWFNRPILSITPFEQEPPWFRKAPEPIEGIKEEHAGWYVNLELINQGKTTANSCQPYISAVGKKVPKGWQKNNNWIPIRLMWSLDTELYERNLIPQMPYFFNGGRITTQIPDHFTFSAHKYLNAQGDFLLAPPGEYCFEITVAGEGVDTVHTYLRVIWKGGFTDPDMKVGDIIAISRLENAPWN